MKLRTAVALTIAISGLTLVQPGFVWAGEGASATSESQPSNVDYFAGDEVDLASFVPFDPVANGASNITGNPNPMVRMDFVSEEGGGGLYSQNAGSFELIWPNTEHAFVLEGEITVHYHATGITTTYGPGDGFVIAKGERLRWEVKSGTFLKSFFSIFDSPDL